LATTDEISIRLFARSSSDYSSKADLADAETEAASSEVSALPLVRGSYRVFFERSGDSDLALASTDLRPPFMKSVIR